MLLWLKQIYLGILFYFYSNHQVTITNDADVRPVVFTYYDGSEIINWIAAQQGLGGQPQKIAFLNAEDQLENPTPEVFYIFSGGTNFGHVIVKHEGLFFNPVILKVVLEASVFTFLKSMYELDPSSMSVQTKKVGNGIWTLVNHIVFVILVFVLYIVSRCIVTKLSMTDPIFSEFNIESSSLINYKDLTYKTVAQCTICFEDFEPDDELRVLECGHYFHPMCIDRWLIAHSKRCPCCRGNIKIGELAD